MNPLSDTWFANVFSHSIDCLLILLFLLMDKILEFSYLFSQKYSFSLFCYCAFAVISKIIAVSDAVKPLPVFSLRVLFGVLNLGPFFHSFTEKYSRLTEVAPW